MAILGGVTLLAAGGMIYWGLRGGSRYNAATAEHEDASDQVRRLEALKPYPKAEHVNAKTTAIKGYRDSLVQVQERFLALRPEAIENVPSAEFAARLLKVSGSAKAKLGEAGTAIPDNFAIGFEAYTTGGQARQEATGMLGYQLDAVGEMFMQLAAARPNEVLNMHRAPLAEEGGGTYERGENEIARALPVEVSFRGEERAAREFLNALVSSDKYYYVIRTIRVANQRQTGPTAEEAKFEEPKPAVVDPFGGGGDFVIPEGDEEPEPEPVDGGEGGEAPAGEEEPAGEPAAAADEDAEEGERILKQLVGDEEVDVFLRIDVMLFHDDIELPEP